jgi:hypothetical protein
MKIEQTRTNDGLRPLNDLFGGLSLLSVLLLIVDCLLNVDPQAKFSAIAGDLGLGTLAFVISLLFSSGGWNE